MKKFFYMSVLVLMAALTLASCGSDNDKKDEPTPSSKSAAYNFTVNISQDLLDISEVTVVYKDGDGKTVREAAKSTKFTKTVNINKFPAVVGTKCEFKLKDGVQLTKEKYDLIATYDHQISINGKDPYGAKLPNSCLSGVAHKLTVSPLMPRVPPALLKTLPSKR